MSDNESRLHNNSVVNSFATGVLAALVALSVFAFDKRSPSPGYWVFALAAVVLTVASVIIGGRAVSKLPHPGGLFNLQAWLCLLGAGAVVMSCFFWGAKEKDELAGKVDVLTQRVQGLEEALRQSTERLTAEMAALQRRAAPVPPKPKAGRGMEGKR